MIDEMKNHSDHAERLKICFVPMQIQVVLRQLHRIDIKTKGQSQERIDCCYREAVPDLNQSLIILAQCNCCTIHQENKPISTNILCKADYRFCAMKSNPTRELTCKCSCRHMARILTRAHLYTGLEYEEDNRIILHEAFMDVTEALRQEIAKIEELKKRKSQKLKQMNSVYKDEDYFIKYSELQYEYYKIVSDIEDQENLFHVYDDKHYQVKQILENHIHDFPNIRCELDNIFMDMYVYPGYDIMYETDFAESDVDMTESDVERDVNTV